MFSNEEKIRTLLPRLKMPCGVVRQLRLTDSAISLSTGAAVAVLFHGTRVDHTEVCCQHRVDGQTKHYVHDVGHGTKEFVVLRMAYIP